MNSLTPNSLPSQVVPPRSRKKKMTSSPSLTRTQGDLTHIFNQGSPARPTRLTRRPVVLLGHLYASWLHQPCCDRRSARKSSSFPCDRPPTRPWVKRLRITREFHIYQSRHLFNTSFSAHGRLIMFQRRHFLREGVRVFKREFEEC